VNLSQIETVTVGSRWSSLTSLRWASQELVVNLEGGQPLRFQAYGAGLWRDLIIQAMSEWKDSSPIQYSGR
jgi:hypothetical protein